MKNKTNNTVVEETVNIEEVKMDLYAEGRTRGYEFIRDNILKDDVQKPVIAGIIDEFAQFLVEIGLTDEFIETLQHTEELNDDPRVWMTPQ